MASIEHDKRTAPKGSSRFVLVAAGVVVVGLIAAFFIGQIADPEPMALGEGVRTDADPVIVTQPADVTAPLSSDAQGAVRVELGSTPANTTD